MTDIAPHCNEDPSDMDWFTVPSSSASYAISAPGSKWER